MYQQNFKTLIFSIALIGIGTAVAAIVWKKTSDASHVNDCPGGHIDLKGHGIIIESHTDDQLLRLTLEKKAGASEILTIDTCSGKVIGTLSLDTDPGMVDE